MKKIKFTLLMGISLFLFFGCSTLKVTHYGKKSGKVEKIVLLYAMIDKIQQPVLPLIDASIFNGKTNSIANEIIIMQQEYADEHRDTLANILKHFFRCPVLFGKSLHEHNGFDALEENLKVEGALYTGDDNFPMIALSSGDFNPFAFHPDYIRHFFDTESNYQSIVAEIADRLGTDLVAIAYSRLQVVSVDAFGLGGKIALYSEIYLFDDQGNLITKAQNRSDSHYLGGKHPEKYAWILDNFTLIVQPMLPEIAINYR